MLLQLLLAVIRRSQIGEKVQQSLLTKSSSSVAGSKISEQFSNIHFHIFIANYVLYYQLHEASCYWWCNCKTFFRYPVSYIYCKIMFCTTNCMKLLLMGLLPTIFQIWGRAIGGVQLSSAEESNPQKDQTGQFAFREQVILSLLIFSFWSYHQKPKQKIFFYKAKTFTHGNENKNIWSALFTGINFLSCLNANKHQVWIW